MIDDSAREFPFVDGLTKPAAKRLLSFWDRFAEFRHMIEDKGVPVAPVLAAKFLGVSRQRVDELAKLGRLERVVFEDHPFIMESSIRWLMEQDRKAGRPAAVDPDKKSRK